MGTDDPFRPVRAGEPIKVSARAWNPLMRVARREAQGRVDAQAQPIRETITILVRNDSGVNLARWGVLALDSPLIDPATNEPGFLERVAMSGVAVTAGNLGSFAVAVEPIENGKIGRCVVRGVQTAIIKENSTSHNYATPVAGSTQLETASSGPVKLLWIQGAGPLGSNRAALISIDGASAEQRVLAKITGAAADGTNKWTYTWEQVENADGSFSTVTGGLTSAANGIAHNWIEANNGATGVQGNGVDVANLPAGFSIQPIGNGAVVELAGPVGFANKSNHWYFSAVNMVDGACP